MIESTPSCDSNHRILVIDDNRAIHEDIRKILSPAGRQLADLDSVEAMLFGDAPAAASTVFEIDSAFQGQEGLAQVQKAMAAGQPYAMAFVDVRMPPGWDGVETIEALWKVYPSLQVVICTAYSDYSWAEISRRLGTNDNLLILKKPFDNIEVTQLAHALTRKWSLGRKAEVDRAGLHERLARQSAELQRAEMAFRTIFEASPIGISLSDMEGRCLQVNRAFEKASGLEAGQMLGKTLVDLGWLESPQSLREIGRSLASFGTVEAQEIRYRHDDDERTGLLWLRAITVNHIPHILTFFLDITDRKQMEEELLRARLGAEAATTAKSAFLANMSHEIRTPLHGVVGLSSLLDESAVSPEAHWMVRLIRASAETLAKILDDVLDYSKIECGKLELERVPFSLRESLDWAVSLFQPKAAAKHLSLTCQVDAELSDRLLGDATRVRQVLANLLSNAIKFTEEGGVHIQVGLADAGGAAGEPLRIRIAVSDTGIGIPEDKVSRLFHAFSQVDASTNRRFGGSGLGLAICRRLAEMMGGAIGVTSESGKGSVFTFMFTAEVADVSGTEPEESGMADFARLRILIAEDNRINQIVAERMIERLGCQADMVSDGGAAIEKVEQTAYDLIFLDLHMPGVDGLEAAKRIRAGSSVGAEVPIVALTASATQEDREACLAAGMDDHLSKPVTMEALRGALARWGGRRSTVGVGRAEANS